MVAVITCKEFWYRIWLRICFLLSMADWPGILYTEDNGGRGGAILLETLP